MTASSGNSKQAAHEGEFVGTHVVFLFYFTFCETLRRKTLTGERRKKMRERRRRGGGEEEEE